MSIKAKHLVSINRACSEIVSQIRPFCNFFTEVQKSAKVSLGLLHDVATFNVLLSCPSPFRYSNRFRNGSATMKIFFP